MAIADTPDAKQITLKNIGPLERAVVPYPTDENGRCTGGIVLFCGPNNAGKSIAIDSTDTLITGRGKVAAKDGTPFGSIEGLGVVLKAGAKNTRRGELEIHSLEGKFDISDVVDPGIKDQAAADARRIKALIQIAQAKPDPALFSELIGEHTDLIKPDTFKTEDLVEMAARVKRDMEAGSRAAETAAENANSKARALREASAGVDLDQPSDQAALQAELEEALKAQAIIKNRASRADELRIAATAARRELTQAETSYEGLTVEQATAREAEAREDASQAEAALRAAEEALRQAQHRHTSACNFVAVCVKDKHAAEAHERNMAGWRAAVKQAEAIDEPTSKEIADAALRLEKARAAAETGVLVRRAKEQAAEALEHQQAGGKWTKRAERLRDAAKETDAVLSSVVGTLKCGLKVDCGRLVMADGDHKGEVFARQSMGTRYAIVAPLAISVLKEGDIFTMRQEAWESLDWNNRAMLYRLCKQARVVLVTGQCDAHEPVGEFRAELFEPLQA